MKIFVKKVSPFSSAKFSSLSFPFSAGNRPGQSSDQKVTRLGLAKHSKLNQRYELDKQDLAKTSALNKRYLLTEADVAVNVETHDRNTDHPGLSHSQLNDRYRSGQSLHSEPESTIDTSGKAGHRRAQSSASDVCLTYNLNSNAFITVPYQIHFWIQFFIEFFWIFLNLNFIFFSKLKKTIFHFFHIFFYIFSGILFVSLIFLFFSFFVFCCF